MKLELSASYIRDTGVSLDGDDLRLGLSLGLISPPTVVAVAVVASDHGVSDETIVRLAHVDPNDAGTIRNLLRVTDSGDADLFPPDSVRKWAYLELKAAYEIRDDLTDPFGVVEQIYADFDYPEAVAEFVRYMPVPRGEPSGEDALLDRWARYLQREAAVLRKAEPSA